PATLAALQYLQRRCAGAAVVVGMVRAGATASDQPVRKLHPDLLVALEPLTANDLAPLGAPNLHAATGGNPRFITDAVSNGKQPEPSRTLSNALIDQCRAEGAHAYRILVAAAALEQPFEPELLAAVVAADTTD